MEAWLVITDSLCFMDTAGDRDGLPRAAKESRPPLAMVLLGVLWAHLFYSR